MRLAARSIFLSILFFIFYFLFFISPVSAQSQNPQVNPYLNPNTTSDVPKNLHTWTQNVMIEVMSAMSCQLSGIDPTNPKAQCLGVDQKTGKIGYVPSAGSGQVGGGGAIGVAGHMITMLYTPPLRTGDYFKYLASNFGIAKPAHAAAGFEGLKPVQSLWVAFRNIVYLLFVIIFIVIGLAIMLRVRIDPRTVMTIQNQIPKIIIGLLLVTFSFAIAGFLIDLMYVVIFLSYELISGAGVLDAKGVPVDFSKLNPLNLQNSSPFAAANGVIGGGVFGIAGNAADAIKDIIINLFALDKTFSIANIILMTISAITGSVIGLLSGPFGIITGPITGVFIYKTVKEILPFSIAFIIIFIALLIALIRLWFVLIMAYVGILLDVVFAPFWIAASLLPGIQIGFGAWLRSIVANLAVFPVVIIMFLLAKAFIDAFGTSKSTTDFVPPLIGNPPGTDLLGPLIGLGIILMTPNVVALVKAAFGVKGVGVGSMIVGGLAGGFNAPGGIIATSGHLGGTLYGLSHLPVIGNLGPLRRIRQGYQQQPPPPPTT